MRRIVVAIRVAGCALLSFGAVFGAVSTAQAQTVTFSDINDALPLRCYSSELTAPDPADPNRLLIGVNSGFAFPSGNSACIASTGSFSPSHTMDTISFLVEAPEGFAVSTISFTQAGSISRSRGGQAFSGATWVVDDIAEVIPSGGGWSAIVDLSEEELTLVPVSITTFLAAGAAGQAGSGSASATSPVVFVEISPIPNQAGACGLVGIELLGIVMIARGARKWRAVRRNG